jgi:hypothetical protein
MMLMQYMKQLNWDFFNPKQKHYLCINNLKTKT